MCWPSESVMVMLPVRWILQPVDNPCNGKHASLRFIMLNPWRGIRTQSTLLHMATVRSPDPLIPPPPLPFHPLVPRARRCAQGVTFGLASVMSTKDYQPKFGINATLG